MSEMHQMPCVSVDCPAKTNLTLHVGEVHEEWGNRHALDTIYCGVGVTDTVTAVQKEPGAGFSLELSGRHLGDLASSSSDMRRNHAVLALFAMAQASGNPADVALSIKKNIPVGAGMAGGSADAAATILALNALWKLDWPLGKLQEVASELGADMPFCLSGGFARGTGFGEKIELLNRHDPQIEALRTQGYTGIMLVGAYQAELSTPEVYAAFDLLGNPEGCPNDLQPAAISLHPRSGTAIETALANGASQAFISGSGPTVIACFPDDASREIVARAWKESGCVDRIISAKAPAYPVVHYAFAGA